jgi:hypothetical protein
MRPWKNISGFSSWLIRITVLLLVVSLFLGSLLSLDLQSQAFYFAAGFVMTALFLFFGGFFNKHTVTMISALILFGLSAYFAWNNFSGLNDIFARYALLSAISLSFLANGNK